LQAPKARTSIITGAAAKRFKTIYSPETLPRPTRANASAAYYDPP
jgi:hypothetical protein